MNVGKIWKISDVGWLKGAMVRDDDIYIHDHDATPYTYNFYLAEFPPHLSHSFIFITYPCSCTTISYLYFTRKQWDHSAI